MSGLKMGHWSQPSIRGSKRKQEVMTPQGGRVGGSQARGRGGKDFLFKLGAGRRGRARHKEVIKEEKGAESCARTTRKQKEVTARGRYGTASPERTSSATNVKTLGSASFRSLKLKSALCGE